MLPQLMREAAQPLGNIEKISVVDTGSSSGETSGANRVTNYATNLLSTGCAASRINCGSISITILKTAASPYSLKALAIFCFASASAFPFANAASASACPANLV